MLCHSNRPFSPRIAIVGRDKDTANYKKALQEMQADFLVTMEANILPDFHGLLLPGGGDITPAFFGQKNRGSRNIDTELDIIQLQALDIFVKQKRPVLGICKGMQVINVYFGGTIRQHIPEAPRHAWENGDKIHPTAIDANSYLCRLYGTHMVTNSAHHQAIGRLGTGLRAIQKASDGILEGIVHDTLPVLGVQWHPERQFGTSAGSAQGPFSSAPPIAGQLADGRPLFSYFLSLCAKEG